MLLHIWQHSQPEISQPSFFSTNLDDVLSTNTDEAVSPLRIWYKDHSTIIQILQKWSAISEKASAFFRICLQPRSLVITFQVWRYSSHTKLNFRAESHSILLFLRKKSATPLTHRNPCLYYWSPNHSKFQFLFENVFVFPGYIHLSSTLYVSEGTVWARV